MAQALMGGIKKKEIAEEIIASDVIDEILEKVKKDYNVKITKNNLNVVNESDIIFLAIKPQVIDTVLEEIKEHIQDQIIVSIAAGIKLSKIEKYLSGKKLVRVMPNTPCLVGEMAGGFATKNLNENEKQTIKKILNASGKAFELEEKLLDAVTGLSGSGPAFVARLIDYFQKAGEEVGLTKEIAYELALKTFLGTAKLLKEKQLSPEELITMVSSPNGTTVAGRKVLESSNAKEIIKNTVKTASERSKELGN